MLRRNPAQVSNTVYLDRWEGPDKATWPFKNGLYKSTRERVAREIALPAAAALAVYRAVNDPVAGALYAEAREQFDDRKMEQVARDYFSTSSGEPAAAWLAEVEMDSGDVRSALARLKQAAAHPAATGPGGKMVSWASRFEFCWHNLKWETSQ